MKITKVVKEHIGRWVDRSQRAVQGERRTFIGLAQHLANHYLHNIAGRNVFLGSAYRL